MRNNRHWMLSSTLALLLVLTVILAQAHTASAHEGHSFYVGIQVPVERVDASYDKTVDNTDASNPRRGDVFHDNDSDDTFAYGVGFLAGYRIPLLTREDGFYVSAELDLAFHGGQAKGQLPGKGESPGRESTRRKLAGPLVLSKKQELRVHDQAGRQSRGAAVMGHERLRPRRYPPHPGAVSESLSRLPACRELYLDDPARVCLGHGQPEPGLYGLDVRRRRGKDAERTPRAPHRSALHPVQQQTLGRIVRHGGRQGPDADRRG